MPALWVLAVLALLLILLLAMPLRVLLSAKNGALTAEVRAGFLRFRIYPPPEAKPPKKKKPSREKKKPDKPKPTESRLTSAQRVLRTVRRLWAPAVGVLRNIQGAVRIDPLTLHVVYAGRDEPADAAILCGDTLAAVWSIMPVAEQVCRVPRPDIAVNVDFDASVLRIEADIGLTLRVWALLVSLRPLLSLLRKEERKSASGQAERAAET